MSFNLDMFQVKVQYSWLLMADPSTLLLQQDEKLSFRKQFWRWEHVVAIV